jgi:quinoprotein glucose dehydrogenase
MASQYVLGPIFTPPIVKDTGGKLATIQLPGAGGGANWMGGAVDPETGMLYVPSTTAPYLSSLQPGGTRSEMQYIAAGSLGGANVMGLPLIKGPYGRITAINLNTGDHAWMIPNGKPQDSLVNNPALKAAGIDASKWGGNQRSPILITKTLLFEGSDNLRAIDKKTGDVIYEMPLGASLTGGTMTYTVNGRQFLVTVVGGQQGGGAELVAVALPVPGAPGPGRGAGRGGNQGAANDNQ